MNACMRKENEGEHEGSQKQKTFVDYRTLVRLSACSVASWRLTGIFAVSYAHVAFIRGVAYDYNFTEWEDRRFRKDDPANVNPDGSVKLSRRHLRAAQLAKKKKDGKLRA